MKKYIGMFCIACGLICMPIHVFANTKSLVPESASLVMNGWEQATDGWIYNKNGQRLTGWLKDNGTWYYLDRNGIMQTGWLSDNGSSYYLYPDGAMASGESVINGKAYTFSENGAYLYDGIRRAGLEDDVITAAWEFYHNNYDVFVHVLNEVNADRAEHGLSPLVLRDDMSIAATYRAFHMHKHNYTDHYRNGVDLANEAFMGYTGTFVDISENIGRRQNLQQKLSGDIYQLGTMLHEGLMNSPSHAMNILRPPYTRVGIGIAYLDDGHYFNLVQLFTDRTDF